MKWIAVFITLIKFGFISTRAKGVVVGSAFVDIIASKVDVSKRLEMLSKDLKEGCKII